MEERFSVEDGAFGGGQGLGGGRLSAEEGGFRWRKGFRWRMGLSVEDRVWVVEGFRRRKGSWWWRAEGGGALRALVVNQ